MDLTDALSSNSTATSPVELSLSPFFRRGHSSVYDAITNFFQPQPLSPDQDPSEAPVLSAVQRREQEQKMTRLIASTIPPLEQRSHHLIALDVTPQARPFAHTLEDRVFTHFPNPITGNRPITIGHPYSVLAYIPEKKNSSEPKWVVPLSVQRVDSQSSETVVGAQQTKSFLEDDQLPFHDDLVVKVADSKYSARPHVSQTAKLNNLIDIVRCAGNRTLYQSPPTLEGQKRPANRPVWYGTKFVMKGQSTWHEPAHTDQMTTVTKKGRKLIFHIQCWDDMLMRGKDGIDMHDKPFRLLRATCVDEHGKKVYKRPMWLMAFGDRRHELSVINILDAFLQRYDIEHFFRFGKQKLLMAAAQTPEVEYEENWWQIVILAYVQLWLAKELARQRLYPWEKQSRSKSTEIATPTLTQRDFGRLIQLFGTPAKPPKPRGYSPGCKKGQKRTPRKRHPVIKKSKTPT